MRTDLLVLVGVLVFALLTMVAYAVSGESKRDDPHDVADRGSFVLGDVVRGWFYWFVGPVERLAVSLGLSPTAFNLLGVAFGVGAGVSFGTGHLNLGGWAVLLGGAERLSMVTILLNGLITVKVTGVPALMLAT